MGERIEGMIDLKTLEQLQIELQPQGEKIDKEEFLGVPLTIQKVKPWKSDGKNNVRIIAVNNDTGELVHFNGGQPMHDGIIDFADHVPFVACVAKYEAKSGRPFYILE